MAISRKQRDYSKYTKRDEAHKPRPLPASIAKQIDAGQAPQSPWLSRAEAAAYLRITPGALNNLHVQKRGPVYYKKAGKIYYLTMDLDDWIRAGKVPAGGTPPDPDRDAGVEDGPECLDRGEPHRTIEPHFVPCPHGKDGCVLNNTDPDSECRHEGVCFPAGHKVKEER